VQPTDSSRARTTSRAALLVLLAIAVGLGCGRDRPARSPSDGEVVLTRGTAFAVRLRDDPARGEARVGQPVEGTVLSALAGDGGSIRCAGWTVVGAVTRIDPPARPDGEATWVLSFRELRPPAGSAIAIRAEASLAGRQARSRSPGVVAGGAIAGAILDRQLAREGIRSPAGEGPEVVARLVGELRLPRSGD